MIRSKRLLTLALLFIFLLPVGCQRSTEPFVNSIAVNPKSDRAPKPEIAQGFINGSEWTYRSGRASLKKRFGTEYFEILLWGEQVDHPCDDSIKKPDLEVRLYSVKKVQESSLEGRDPFAKFPLLVFADQGIIIADKGSISIEKISQDEVSGFIRGSFPTSTQVLRTEVQGSFAVSICQK